MEEYLTLSKAQETFVKKYLPSKSTTMGIANFFSIFSDYTRVRIITALSIADMCVGDLSYLLQINQSTLSHQLKLLRDAKMVDCRRLGKVTVYYIINPFINDAMATGVDNFNRENGTYSVLDEYA